MIAKEFAKHILCINHSINNECKCKSCIEFETNNNPDFLIIETDGNSIKIEQIRNLQKQVQEKPIMCDKKIYIIDNADLMTKEAQNCLLKTLEEPPEYVTIILIGTNENSFLTTIKSRCMLIYFETLSNQLIKEFLEKELNIINPNEELLDMFEGSIGKAIQLKDKQEEYEKIVDFVKKLDNTDIIDLYKLSEPLYKLKEEIFDILDYINVLLIKKAKEKIIYANCIKIVEETKTRLKQNANYDMSIDNMVFNMWEEII